MAQAGQRLYRVRLGSKGAVYLPREVARSLGLAEGSELLLRVEDGRIILTPVSDPLELALHGRKYARVTAEELEEWSEEWQASELGL